MVKNQKRFASESMPSNERQGDSPQKKKKKPWVRWEIYRKSKETLISLINKILRRAPEITAFAHFKRYSFAPRFNNQALVKNCLSNLKANLLFSIIRMKSEQRFPQRYEAFRAVHPRVMDRNRPIDSWLSYRISAGHPTTWKIHAFPTMTVTLDGGDFSSLLHCISADDAMRPSRYFTESNQPL